MYFVKQLKNIWRVQWFYFQNIPCRELSGYLKCIDLQAKLVVWEMNFFQGILSKWLCNENPVHWVKIILIRPVPYISDCGVRRARAFPACASHETGLILITHHMRHALFCLRYTWHRPYPTDATHETGPALIIQHTRQALPCVSNTWHDKPCPAYATRETYLAQLTQPMSWQALPCLRNI